MEKTLITFYSWSGNTEKIAGIIGQLTGGRIFKLVPVRLYPKNYNACTVQAKKEIHAGVLPELTAMPENLDSYDTVFIGSPNWWSTMAPPVSAFLAGVDLSGKKIVPFFSHGGGGAGHFVKDIAAMCTRSILLEPFIQSGSCGDVAAGLIAAWLKGLGFSGEREA